MRIEQSEHPASARARLGWPIEDGARHTCQTPLLDSKASEITGLWGGPPEDPSWGLSVHDANGLLSVVVCAHDAAGDPRWVLGQTTWAGNGRAVLPLRRMRAACRACPGRQPTEVAAGMLELDFDRSLLAIDARFDQGAAWTRDAIPMRRPTGREQ